MLNAFHMSLTTTSFAWSYLRYKVPQYQLTWSLGQTTVYNDVYSVGYEKNHFYSYSIILLSIPDFSHLYTMHCIMLRRHAHTSIQVVILNDRITPDFPIGPSQPRSEHHHSASPNSKHLDLSQCPDYIHHLPPCLFHI